ncbi:MAG: hypothetical protein RR406_00005 [Bacilli bacterium]
MSKVKIINDIEESIVKPGDFLLINVEYYKNILVRYCKINYNNNVLLKLDSNVSWDFDLVTQVPFIEKDEDKILTGRKYKNSYGTVIEILSKVNVTINITKEYK